MGAWGPGNFENDSALDWIAGMGEARDAALVVEALTRAADADGYIESDVGCEALAAAELVAAALGLGPAPPDANPTVIEKVPMLAEWADDATAEANELAAELPELAAEAALARRAVAKVLDSEQSELYGLWEEDAGWLAVVADLQRRLEAS